MQTSTFASIGTRLQSIGEYWLPSSVLAVFGWTADTLGLGHYTTNLAVYLIIADWVLGILRAGLAHEICSAGWRRGLRKVALYAILLAMATFLRGPAGQDNSVLRLFSEWLLAGIVIPEFLSVLNNFSLVLQRARVGTREVDAMIAHARKFDPRSIGRAPVVKAKKTLHHGIRNETIWLSNSVDFANAEELRVLVSETVTKWKRLTLDLEHCEIFDSSAIGVLLSARRQLAMSHGVNDVRAAIVVDKPSAHIAKVLRVVGVSELVTVTNVQADITSATTAGAVDADKQEEVNP